MSVYRAVELLTFGHSSFRSADMNQGDFVCFLHIFAT